MKQRAMKSKRPGESAPAGTLPKKGVNTITDNLLGEGAGEDPEHMQRMLLGCGSKVGHSPRQPRETRAKQPSPARIEIAAVWKSNIKEGTPQGKSQ